MEQLGSYWTIFVKVDILVFLENMPRKFNVSSKSDKNNRYFA
jgi:hypothetical protein